MLKVKTPGSLPVQLTSTTNLVKLPSVHREVCKILLGHSAVNQTEESYRIHREEGVQGGGSVHINFRNRRAKGTDFLIYCPCLDNYTSILIDSSSKLLVFKAVTSSLSGSYFKLFKTQMFRVTFRFLLNQMRADSPRLQTSVFELQVRQHPFKSDFLSWPL